MEYTPENIEKIAGEITDGFTKEELYDFVYQDLVSLMDEDRDMFDMNAESLGYDATCRSEDD